MRRVKVAIAMSGGVDSGVAAALLVKQGYHCSGFHMHLWHEPGVRGEVSFENKCCSTESLEAARKTAHKLGMPFYVIEMAEIFKRRVVDYFLKGYTAGLTPNPCVMCNRFIKFGELLDYVRRLGFDYLATGHYARIVFGARLPLFSETPNHRGSGQARAEVPPRLLMAKDKTKDQSYFLYNLTQEQLAHLLFPIGDYLKKEVVEMAKKWKLAVAHRPESQEICFYPESDYRPFLRRHINNSIRPGEVADVKGNIIGHHSGLPLYTIGQRHGFEINSKLKSQNSKLIMPYYVVAKDAKRNRLVVGFGKETERKEFWIKDASWIDPNFQFSIFNFQLFARIRNLGELHECVLERDKRKHLLPITYCVFLAEPQRGIAPGQAAVFYRDIKFKIANRKYKGFEVLGGGIIN